MAVTVSGMFGGGKTYFANSPVIIDINGLSWEDLRFTIVLVDVMYQDAKMGSFRLDTRGETSVSFDISSALKAIWSDYDFEKEVAAATSAKLSADILPSYVPEDDEDFPANGLRGYREYSVTVYTEQFDSINGEPVRTFVGTFTGGRCAIGGFNEWERSFVANKEDAIVSYQANNTRYGKASTKPTSEVETVGIDSITSWIAIGNSGTDEFYYPPAAVGMHDMSLRHPPRVLRDSQEYVDFLFVNRKGALETCSALTKEAMNINVEMTQYARLGRQSFSPQRSLMTFGTNGRRTWQMSTGYITREWAEWWAMEFLGGEKKKWWMWYKGRFVPVVVEPDKKEMEIYDKAKQQMPHVDFTVTLALEG